MEAEFFGGWGEGGVMKNVVNKHIAMIIQQRVNFQDKNGKTLICQ